MVAMEFVPGIDAGMVEAYLKRQGVDVRSVTVTEHAIIIDSDDDIAPHAPALRELVAQRNNQRQSDIQTVKTFLSSSQQATLTQLNAVMRSFIRIVRSEFQD